MTAYLVQASAADCRHLWSRALADTAMAFSFMRPGSAGRLFGDTLADLLVAAGRAQPCLTQSPRAVSRTDLGRLQVALARSRRDVLLLGAERVTAADAELLTLCATRAGVDVFLLADGQSDPGVNDVVERLGAVASTEEVEAQWAARPTAGTRARPWSCHAALAIGSGTRAACPQHPDALACVLAWFPHAFATAQASPLAIRARLYELSRVSTGWALRAWPHARDVHHGAALAARQMDLPAAARRTARVEDLSADASTLTWQGNTLEVPEACREVLHVARADKLADGFAPTVSLFQVRDTSLQRYVTAGQKHQAQ